MIETLSAFWPHVVAGISFAMALVASGHVVLYKRDSRGAVAWVGLIWLAPVVGSVLYVLLGINRIRRRAAAVRGAPPPVVEPGISSAALAALLPPESRHLAALERVVSAVDRRPLAGENRLAVLREGDAAYPAMIEAIDRAERSVALTSYIFNVDAAGDRFRDALARAVARGVAVRVLIDAVGARYSGASMPRALRRAGVPVERFMPNRVPVRIPYLNLRNHRKILVVDGRIGFTGGTNIREECLSAGRPGPAVRDLHFRVEGPVVAHLRDVFAEDWLFAADERLEGEAWFPPLAPAGLSAARGIAGGPDEDFEKLRWILPAALGAARRSVRILTPYFLPDAGLVTALNLAAMRGVRVDVVLPERSNLALIQWASAALLWQVLERGVRVHRTPPPFDHTKLMVVDRAWILLGSSNWDARSFRLNFEFDLEVYDPVLGAALDDLAAERIASGREMTKAEADGRPLPARLRDGAARLCQPYL